MNREGQGTELPGDFVTELKNSNHTDGNAFMYVEFIIRKKFNMTLPTDGSFTFGMYSPPARSSDRFYFVCSCKYNDTYLSNNGVKLTNSKLDN